MTAIVDPIKQSPISSSPVETTETTLEEIIINPEFIVEEPEPLVASYNKGLDLIIVNQFQPFSVVFWDSNQNNYYWCHEIEETNGIRYSLDTNKIHETLFNAGLSKRGTGFVC